MNIYSCPACHARVFFENLNCLSCGGELAYEPIADAMRTLPVQNDQNATQSVCANRSNHILCNWLVADSSTNALCLCCRYTRTIPPLDDVSHQQAWRNLEQAKRYLFYSLVRLALPMPDRQQQPDSGLAFDFLVQLPDAPNVLTGHADGVITINIAEANDVSRESCRVSLREAYRTVLGHLRHEIGHFYWDQLVANTGWHEDFRAMFGDERDDYAQALRRHYEASDVCNWQAGFISYYASAHPWEDWAETWAHYLHITDALDTAMAWRVSTGDISGTHVERVGSQIDEQQFRNVLLEQWLPLCQYLNAACRSLGEPDAYPFVLPPPVVDKLAFVHAVITASGRQQHDGDSDISRRRETTETGAPC